MKNTLFILMLLLVAVRSLYGQQELHYTQFMYNKLLINPAYAGAREVPSITALYRHQWLGFEGAPKSVLASFSTPFLSKRVGFGLTLSQYQIGLQSDFNASFAYSYKLISTEDVAFRAGIMGSIRSHGISFDDATPIKPGDPSLEDQTIRDVSGNFGLGLYSVFKDQFYVGFSVPRLYSNTIGINPNLDVPTAKEYPHFYGMMGGILPMTENLSLMPAILIKGVKNAPMDADINVNLEFMKKVTAGVSYRLGGDGPGESVDLLAYWQVTPQIGVGAAYDLTLSGLKDYSAGSIEFLVQADLKKLPPRRMSNPRFFL